MKPSLLGGAQICARYGCREEEIWREVGRAVADQDAAK